MDLCRDRLHESYACTQLRIWPFVTASVQRAAEAEEADMTVARIMKDKVGRMITAAADDSILSVAAGLTRHRIGALMVLDDAGNLAGMIL